MENAPEHPFANYDLALIYHGREEKEKALTFYEKATAINPELKTEVNDQAFSFVIEEEIPNTINQQIEDEIVELEEAKHEPIATKPTEGKIVLITGASSGIGKATAQKFAKEGYRLILTGRRQAKLLVLKESFEEAFNTQVQILSFDIQSLPLTKQAISELAEDWKSVDILINNAGIARGEKPIHEGEFDHWETMIDTNIKGLLYVTREVVPTMVKRRKGQIINVCCIAGKEVYPNNGVYCATKHAVDALTKAMRLDLHKYDIRVSQVSPGFVEDTEFAKVKQTGTAEGETIPFTDFVPVNAQNVADVIYFIATQPQHVTLQEVVLAGTQQASANHINRSGRN